MDNERKLTQLESAMLGLYLLGMRWIASNDAGLSFSAYSTKPELIQERFEYWWADGDTWIDFSDNGSSRPEACGLVAGLLPTTECIELLPWLTAHNVPIPEVEG